MEMCQFIVSVHGTRRYLAIEDQEYPIKSWLFIKELS